MINRRPFNPHPLIRLTIYVAIVFCRGISTGLAQTVPEAGIDSLFAEVDNRTSPGAVVGILLDGEVVFKQGYGLACLEYSIPNSTFTVFDIASVSKQFCGLAVAMLVEEGRLSLDDDIRRYISEVPDFGTTITIDHLVHHTSGLRDWPGTLSLAGWRMDDIILFKDILRMVQFQKDLNFTPGDEYLYSNTGYNLLAEAVARITGSSFREWTDERIFGPLDMEDTHFHDNHQDVVPNRAWAYRKENGVFQRIENGLTAMGSSSLYTTVDDLMKWVKNFDSKIVGGVEAHRLIENRGVLNNGKKIAYAFGQNVGRYRGLKTVSHGGSWAGFLTHLLRFPEQRFAVVLLSNNPTFRAGRVAYHLADLYLEDALEPVSAEQSPGLKEEVKVPAEILDLYLGSYRLGPGWFVTITREGDQMYAQASREDRFPMKPVSRREFWVEDYGASIVFETKGKKQAPLFRYRGIRAPRVIFVVPPAEALVEYTGDYWSHELKTSYTFLVKDGELIARHQKHEDIRFSPTIRDTFESEAWWMREIVFVRDGMNRLNGMLVTSGRSRNQRFIRVSL